MVYNPDMNESPTDNVAGNSTGNTTGDLTGQRRKCPCAIAARLTNGVYYLALGTWFGAIVMLAISAAVTFHTVRAYEPTLHASPWNQPELAAQAPVILAGAIVGGSVHALNIVQIICAIIVALTLIAQHTAFRSYLSCRITSVRNIVRLILIAIPAAVLLLTLCWIMPNILVHRSIMWDMTQTTAVREQAHDDFEHFHKLSERTVGFASFALAGSVLVSSLVLGSSQRESKTPA